MHQKLNEWAELPN